MTRDLGKNPTEASTGWWKVFLDVYRSTGQITAAAGAAGVHRSTVYRHVREYTEFGEAFLEAREQAIDALESEAWRRAKDGVPRLREVGGKVITEHEYSDRLLTFLLQSLRPAVYRPTQNLHHTGELGLAGLMAEADGVDDPVEDVGGSDAG